MTCTNTNQDLALLHEEQKLKTDLSELREWADQRMTKQMMLHDQMVIYYDRMMTKCIVYQEELERTLTENARFKFTSQCLMDKIKELTSGGDKKSSINPGNNDTNHDKDNDDDNDVDENCDKENDNDKVENCDKDNDNDIDNNEDEDTDNDTDPIAKYLEVCSKTLIDKVSVYREQAEKVKLELDNINDQLDKSVKTQVCLRRCVDELTVLAETERMKRDRDELELRTTVDKLTAELVEVKQDIDRLESVKAEISVKLMHRESVQNELDEVVRADNAQLQDQLGQSAIAEAALQSKVHNLEMELSKRTEAAKKQQEQSQVGIGKESIDSSSTSLILYQCNLSRTSDDQVTSFSDLGRGDDQLIPCLLSSTKSCSVAEDVQLSCSQSTDDDKQQLSCLELTDEDRRPSFPTSNVVQDSAETVAEPSPEELRNRRLAELIKQYESKHDDDS